ncbi:hemagglutinin/amebocyte aggregation factor-like, partial [Plakobranchus ocellatus]
DIAQGLGSPSCGKDIGRFLTFGQNMRKSSALALRKDVPQEERYIVPRSTPPPSSADDPLATPLLRRLPYRIRPKPVPTTVISLLQLEVQAIFPKFRRSIMSSVEALFAALTLALIAGAANARFNTSYDRNFRVACPGGQILKAIYSVHNNGKEDRAWRLNCDEAPNEASIPTCLWTGYVNDWDGPVSFMCPSNYVMTGMGSYHNNRVEDRRFRFKCCTQRGYKTSSCSITFYENSWDGMLQYTVPNGKAIVGTTSEHNNRYEDRRFKFIVCDFGQLVPAS